MVADKDRHDKELPLKSPFQNIVIIGLGLIGASLAASLKKAYPQVYICGADTDSRTCVVAEEHGWVDRACLPSDGSLEAFLKESADLVIIATPVSGVDEYFALIAKSGFTGVVTDTISTKAHILQAADELLTLKENYIPGHPMSGSEQSGIDGARSDLFEGTNWILCPNENTDPDQFQQLHELIHGMDARVISLPREDHDRAVAIVSHVPHMVASALMRLACEHTDERRSLLRLAAGGFKDTTRVAAGSSKLWCGIAFDNAQALKEGLGEMTEILDSYIRALDAEDREQFTQLLEISSKARNALPAAWVPGSDKLLEVRIPMVNRTGVIAEVTTIASSVGCNIQSIEIDHISEGNAYLSLILTDEGDIGQLSYQLINAGYTVSFRPIEPKE